jgi:hypothetical protein
MNISMPSPLTSLAPGRPLPGEIPTGGRSLYPAIGGLS